MQGLSDEQIAELHLRDPWADKSYPSGGSIINHDPIGRRTGTGWPYLMIFQRILFRTGSLASSTCLILCCSASPQACRGDEAHHLRGQGRCLRGSLLLLVVSSHSHHECVQDLVKGNVALTKEAIADAVDKLRGAVMIVYPMGLPPHDEVRCILDGTEDHSGKQVRTDTALCHHSLTVLFISVCFTPKLTSYVCRRHCR